MIYSCLDPFYNSTFPIIFGVARSPSPRPSAKFLARRCFRVVSHYIQSSIEPFASTHAIHLTSRKPSRSKTSSAARSKSISLDVPVCQRATKHLSRTITPQAQYAHSGRRADFLVGRRIHHPSNLYIEITGIFDFHLPSSGGFWIALSTILTSSFIQFRSPRAITAYHCIFDSYDGTCDNATTS